MIYNIAILILNYNGIEKLGISTLTQCIEGALNVKGNCDVYVIDNGSRDGSVDFLKKFDINIISFNNNYGFTGAYNLAIKKIFLNKRYDYLILMNNDYIITNEECASQSLKYFENNKRIASAQCINLKEDKKTIADVSGFLDVFFNNIQRFKDYKIYEYPEKISYVTANVGAFFMLDVNKLIEIKRFPYIFDNSYYLDFEDLELDTAIWSNGYYCAVLPIEGGVHLENRTIQRSNPIRQYLISRNRVMCMRKLWKRKLLSFTFKFSLLKRSFYEIKYKRKERIKGIYDGLFKKYYYIIDNKYYPLLIIPKSQDMLSSCFFTKIWIAKLEKFKTMFITDYEIKKLSLPFLIPAT